MMSHRCTILRITLGMCLYTTAAQSTTPEDAVYGIHKGETPDWADFAPQCSTAEAEVDTGHADPQTYRIYAACEAFARAGYPLGWKPSTLTPEARDAVQRARETESYVPIGPSEDAEYTRVRFADVLDRVPDAPSVEAVAGTDDALDPVTITYRSLEVAAGLMCLVSMGYGIHAALERREVESLVDSTLSNAELDARSADYVSSRDIAIGLGAGCGAVLATVIPLDVLNIGEGATPELSIHADQQTTMFTATVRF